MSSPFLGEIRMFAGNFAPVHWAFCNGQLLSIAQNTALFSLLGTTYGGNGTTTFSLPNLQGRIPIGQGQGPGLSDYVLGEQAGVESHALTNVQMPAHSHTPRSNSGNGTQASGAGNVWASTGLNGAVSLNQYISPAGNVNAATGAAIGIVGGNQPHENRMPFIALNFIISMAGIFPSRN